MNPQTADLETAPAGVKNLRRVVIDLVSRVEGHGKVTLLLDEDDRQDDGESFCRRAQQRHDI